MNKTIAVTGITGHSGRFFLNELESHRFQGTIKCLVRETSDTAQLDRSSIKIEKVTGDVRDPAKLREVSKGADVFLHIFSIHQSEEVLKASLENGVPRVVMVHTTGVYSKFKSASAGYMAIEEKIEEMRKASDIDLTILRPTMIFGDLCDHNIRKFIEMVDKYPFMPEISGGCGKIQPVNARDLAKAYYEVIMRDRLPEVCYDLSGERSLTLHELFDVIGEFLGKKVRHLSFPMWLGKAGAKAVRAMSFGKLDLVEKVLRMGENRDYPHDKATSDFGYDPEPFDTGLKREVEQFRRSKT